MNNECCQKTSKTISDVEITRIVGTHQDTENMSSFGLGVASGNADFPTSRVAVAETDIVAPSLP